MAAHALVPDPVLGQLVLTDDDDIRHVYAITRAEYNVYRKHPLHWLTLALEADVKIEPDSHDNPEPNLELNLFFSESPEPQLHAGSSFQVRSYDEKEYNLALMYYWTHRPFDGEILVESVRNAQLTARVSGDSDNDPVVLRAVFDHNPELVRSFD